MPGMNKSSRTIQLIERSLHRVETDASSTSLDALGAGAVGAGEVVDVLDELEAGLVAGGVATVVDFCSVHAVTASVRAATARMVLYMLNSLVE